MSIFKKLWAYSEKIPAGNFIFSKIIGHWIPYTGTINPEILELGEGRARVRMQDRRGVRNHLKSVHAVALMNLAELTSGLALSSKGPEGMRFILREFRIEYLKKARGPLIAEAQCPTIPSGDKADCQLGVFVRDASNTVVCQATALWRVSFERGKLP